MPSLYIITGSNGAGKSSIGRLFLPEVVQSHPIFDGDKTFLMQKRALRKEGLKVDKEVSQRASDYTDELFARLSEEALREKKDFLYEGHFTIEGSWDLPRKFKKAGYEIHGLFLGLPILELSQSRVKERAFLGGHVWIH